MPEKHYISGTWKDQVKQALPCHLGILLLGRKGHPADLAIKTKGQMGQSALWIYFQRM